MLLSVLAVCLVPFAPLARAEGNVLQNQAVNGGTVNQNIVFVDVGSHWANDAIYDMARKGIISGYDDASFKPENAITREEFAKLIAATFSLDLGTGVAPTFSDVQKDRWSYSYIEVTKDYLTGYYPPKGQAFFSPETNATREDVAVALVKILGYGPDDLVNSGSLSWRFTDVEEISFGLRDYVALAAENQLISGYEDRTFRPQNPITRAEVATLLYKVIKSSAQDQADGPKLEVSMPEKTTTGTFYVSGSASKGAKVTINGKAVEMVNGTFKEGFVLEEEGEFHVTVTAKLSSGTANVVRKQITYKVDGPEIKLYSIPESSEKDSITVSGKVTDKTDDKPLLYLNGEKQYVDWDGEFNTRVNLQEGDNTLTFKAVNKNDKTTEVVKVVRFNAGGPVLKISNVPESTKTSRLTINGNVTDANDDNPDVYVNGYKVYVSWDGSFSHTITLDSGENAITFKAENSIGKVSTVVKKVVFESGGPVLKVNSVPESTSTSRLTFNGNVTDANDDNPDVYVNGYKLYVSWDGSFSHTVTLASGENEFTFKAENNIGKVSTVVKKIVFESGGPELKVDETPATVNSSSLSISGTVKDKNNEDLTLYLNNEKLYPDWNGKFTHKVKLAEGENILTLKATNESGKVSTVNRTVVFSVPAPELVIDYLPQRTTLKRLTLSGSVKDKNDSDPKVYLNDSLLNLNWNNAFSREVTLNKGENVFVILSTNKLGKSTTVTKTVYQD
jgi:hypothetical protein